MPDLDLPDRNCSDTKREGPYLHTEPSNPLDALIDPDLPFYLQTSELAKHSVCLVTPATTHDGLRPRHSQQQNKTDRTPALTSLHSDTHRNPAENISYSHLQIIYTPRAQALYPFKFTRPQTSQTSFKLSLSLPLPKSLRQHSN
jgi:hypothetical protein